MTSRFEADLVFARDDVSKDNHVVIVQEFLSSSGEIDTIELAGGKKATSKSLIRSLYEEPCQHTSGSGDWDVRPVRKIHPRSD